MMLTVSQPTAGLAVELAAYGLGQPGEYIDQVVPMRIGDAGHLMWLRAVDVRGDVTTLTFEMADADLCWEALAQPAARRVA